jgi:ABC-type glycerol-3-phosphate transport system permease component
MTTGEQAEQGAQGTTARVAAVATLETGVRAPRIRVRPTTIALAVLFILLSLLFFVPLYWMILSSMRPQGEIFGTSINLLPTGLSLDNYVRLINTTPFVKWFWNSVVQSLGYATITVALCATAGFAFARYRFRGRTIIFWTILLSQMLPFQLLIVPLFVEIVKLGLVETYVGAVVPLAAHPIGLLFMRQYMMGMSEEMLSAARVDGANEYRLFWSVALPNARPAIATLFILFSLEYWNNLLWPLIVFRNQNNMPLAVGLAGMVNQYKVSYDLLLAGSTLATLPIIALFLLLRRHFMEGAAALGTGAQ